MVMVRGKGGVEVGTKRRWSKGVKMGTERDFAWANKHMTQCADDVLLSCTLDICMIL